MLKKLIMSIVVANFLIMIAGVITSIDSRNYYDLAYANNTTATWGVGVTVPSYFEINAALKEVDASGNILWSSNPASIDFGTLQEVNDINGTLLYMQGETAYVVLMSPVTSGQRFELRQQGTALTNGATGQIAEAYVMTPDYQALDEVPVGTPQGLCPGILGAPNQAGPTTGTGNLVYTSDLSATSKMVRSFLSIRGPDAATGDIRNYTKGYDLSGNPSGTAQIYGGWVPVTKEQEGGAYTASVTYELIAI